MGWKFGSPLVQAGMASLALIFVCCGGSSYFFGAGFNWFFVMMLFIDFAIILPDFLLYPPDKTISIGIVDVQNSDPWVISKY
jgi:hypothetical protein